MLRIKNIAKWYNDQPVLRDVSFDLKQGEIIGIVGPSGAGKSVLLKLLGRVEQPDAGEISLESADSEKSAAVGFLFQEGALFDSMTVLENVSFPLFSAVPDISRHEANQRAFDILGEVGLSRAYKKVPGQLSGGMRRRVALARALVARPDLVLLDDPTGGLDPVAASVIMKLIARLHQQYNPTIVMVSHDIRRLLPNVERILALFDGVLIANEYTGNLRENAGPRVLKFLGTRYEFGQAGV